MTDDKGACEGPYRVVQPVDMTPLTVEGPTGNHGQMLQGEFLCNALNAAYAEGRKSMENEIKELLELARKKLKEGAGD